MVENISINFSHTRIPCVHAANRSSNTHTYKKLCRVIRHTTAHHHMWQVPWHTHTHAIAHRAEQHLSHEVRSRALSYWEGSNHTIHILCVYGAARTWLRKYRDCVRWRNPTLRRTDKGEMKTRTHTRTHMHTHEPHIKPTVNVYKLRGTAKGDGAL